MTGQAVVRRRPCRFRTFPSKAPTKAALRDLIMDSGFRALLAVPLMREDQVMGALGVARNAAR